MSDILEVIKRVYNSEGYEIGYERVESIEHHDAKVKAELIKEFRKSLNEFEKHCENTLCPDCWMDNSNETCLHQWMEEKIFDMVAKEIFDD